jgi:hypothetical protein
MLSLTEQVAEAFRNALAIVTFGAGLNIALELILLRNRTWP